MGVSGVCSVLLNGQLVSGCLTLAVFADGAQITTIEGSANYKCKMVRVFTRRALEEAVGRLRQA